jgi:hypothetical protein
MVSNKASFYGEDLSTSRLASKVEDHPLTAVRNCLFSIFIDTLHPQPEDAPCRGDRDLRINPTVHTLEAGFYECSEATKWVYPI